MSLPITPGATRLLVEKERQPFVYVAVNLDKLPAAIARSEVGAPTAQNEIQFRDEVLERLEES